MTWEQIKEFEKLLADGFPFEECYNEEIPNAFKMRDWANLQKIYLIPTRYQFKKKGGNNKIIEDYLDELYKV